MSRIFIISILAATFLLSVTTPFAAKTAVEAGDPTKVDFILPFKEAHKKVKKKKRLFFVKPVLGGVDEEGALDYRCGTW